MEFGGNSRVLVNPLRVKDWVVSELRPRCFLYYTGKSRTSGDIILEQSRNVRDRNELALDAMHSIKEEAFRMKECLRAMATSSCSTTSFAAVGNPKKRMASRITNDHIERLYACAPMPRVLRQDLRRGRWRIYDVPHRSDPTKTKSPPRCAPITTAATAYGCQFHGRRGAGMESS